MPIRPDQLTDRSLRIVFRGVSRSEVRATLADVAGDYEAALAEVDRLRAELAGVSAKLVAAHADEREATRVISRAETDASAIRQRAAETAAGLEQKAEQQLAELLRAAEAERAELAALMTRCSEARTRLAEVLQHEIGELRRAVSAPQPEPRTVTEPAAPEPAPPLPSIGAGRHGGDSWSAEDIETALQSLASFNGIPASAETSSPDRDADGLDTTADPFFGIRGIAADPRYPMDADGEPAGDPDAERRPRRHLKTAAMTVGALGACAVVAVMAFPRGGPPHVAERTAGAVETPAAQAAAPPAVGTLQPPTDAPAAGPATSDGAPDGQAAPLVVRVQAIRPCWISLTINGNKESRLLGQGEELVRHADADIVLRVGDAGAIAVFVNGDRLILPGGDGEVITRRIPVPAR